MDGIDCGTIAWTTRPCRDCVRVCVCERACARWCEFSSRVGYSVHVRVVFQRKKPGVLQS